jgi:cytosine/adenosine deaminase-related metal-dependent hydrolase
MILHGARVLDLDPIGVREVDVRVEGGVIVEVAPQILGDRIVDLTGRWLMPGLVVAHHHLYSALACGMPFLDTTPQSFTEMLEQVWWRLDRALDLDAVEVSALVGGVGALRAGVTTIVDHHASPNAILGSLERLDGALGQLGLRRVLAYEVTDRHGRDDARLGIQAHEGLLGRRDPMRSVLVGMHAGITLSDETIRECVALANAAGVGVHVHVAEAVDDVVGGSPLARLDRLGALTPKSVIAHGVHLGPEDLRRVADTGVWLTHQPRSNMNNAVGYAPLAGFPARTALGTDGIGADLFSELQAGYFRSQEGHVGWGPARWAEVLAAGARLAAEQLGVSLGRVAPGFAADLVVLDPVPGPPLLADNLASALIFRFGAGMVRDVMVAGEWRLRDRMPVGVDVAELDRRAGETARAVWGRMRVTQNGS